MLSWTVMTPYYSEDVIYSKKDCLTSPAASSTDGVTTMLYLQVSQCTRWQDNASAVGSILLMADWHVASVSTAAADAVQVGLEELPGAHGAQGRQQGASDEPRGTTQLAQRNLTLA